MKLLPKLVKLAAIFFGVALVNAEFCENTPISRDCWGEYSSSTDYSSYWLSVQNVTLAPDGYERQMLVFNGSYPGPRLEANWGDMLLIHVTNELTNNGTAVHWHGIRQQGNNQYDGVPGVTQCPIAPGESMTYKFRAAQYGTSWYHSHWSLQLSDGLYGPLIIYGPATADYDVDLGPIFMTDWYHQSAFILWAQSGMYGGFPVRHNAVAPNGLINGTNTFPCDDSNDPACLGTGKRSETVIQKGKKYRLRLLDAQADGWMKFSIDGHKLTVIAADLVPIVPYQTDSVILTSGIIRYEGASQADPTTEQWSSITNSCGDEPYASLVPYVRKDVGNADSQKNLNIGWFYETDLVFHWAINTKALEIDWRRPTDLLIYHNQSVFPSDYNIYEISADKTWTYWVIQDLGFVNAYHPFHLHGHDFYILAQGFGLYTPVTKLNRKNPPRRDTATMAGSGYLVIAFENDNPGSWLMHCHIAWHTSQSLALQFVEHQSEIPELVASVSADFESTCAKWETYYKSSLHKQDDSGV
ncbi:hypothetical protein PENFLA_c004G08458 [Penicillium flavigenum]|uniref:Laccase n=1 Tax=Penicillium flavigenum TaxID=254877 RepID=A0A1V6TSG1_9EURO|nr:hypothetical protein PENFLA_c004G08458 [Penicillium flavigenum]